MESILLQDETPYDSLARAQTILRFIQSWAEMWHGCEPSKDELDGLIYTTEAVSLLIEKAQEKMK